MSFQLQAVLGPKQMKFLDQLSFPLQNRQYLTPSITPRFHFSFFSLFFIRKLYIQLVLSREPHPPAILMGEGSAILARVHWSHTQVG